LSYVVVANKQNIFSYKLYIYDSCINIFTIVKFDLTMLDPLYKKIVRLQNKARF